MHAVHAQIAALAEGVGNRTGLVERTATRLIGFVLAQVVQMAVGARGQPRAAGIARHPQRPFAQLPHDAAGPGAMQRINLG